jgi:hypothetical protein
MLAYRRFDRGFIERLGLLAGRLVAATHPHDDATDASQARALDHALIEADEDRAEAPADAAAGRLITRLLVC